MKLTGILILFVFLEVSAKTNAQKLSISLKASPLEKVFTEIEKQTDYTFFYDVTILKGVKAVTVEMKDASVDMILSTVFKDKGLDLDYYINDRTIFIKRRGENNFRVINAGGDPHKIVKVTGTVYNEAGQPLSGANVTINKSQKGTITNARGEFNLGNILLNDIITISFIGYAPQQIKVKDSTNIKVYLTIAKNELDKVVVQAYGNTTQRLTTGDIATVSAVEIEKQPVSNVLTALEGKVPGLVVTQTSGYASAPFTVEIRGRSGIDASRPSEPLYIIDGVPLTVLESGLGGNYASGSTGFLQNGMTGPAGGQSPLFSINPNDIEAISVLKDADATAIYGSRGANGVILITTKNGANSKSTFDLTAYQGISEVTRNYSMLNTNQYLTVRHEALNNDGITPDDGNAYDLLLWDTTRNIDWQKQLWGRMGQNFNLQSAVSGGDKQNSFRISGSYSRLTDILTASGANQRASIQSNVTHTSSNERLGVTFINSYSYAYLNLVEVPGGVTLPPDAPSIYASHGQLNWTGWAPSASPFGTLLQPYTASTGFLNSSLAMKYLLFKGFSLSARLGYSATHVQQQQLTPIASQNPANSPTGSATFGANNNTNAIVEPQIDYKTNLAKGEMETLLGASFQTVSQTGSVAYGNGYLNDNLLRSIVNAPVQYSSANSDQYKYGATFLRINYNWANTYLLNLSARRDGSSRFGPGKQFGNFGSIGAAWIFSEEKWMKEHFEFLSFGKLRGSFGITGSDNISDYQFLSIYSSIQTPYIQGTSSYLPTGLANPTLQWQVNKKLEGALDLGFIDDRITTEFAWYSNHCSNQLVTQPLPSQTGFSSVTANLPALIQNQGLESTIKVKIIDSKKLQWSFNFDIGANRNKLLAFPDLNQSVYYGTFTIGKPLTIAKLLHYTGVDPATGQYTFQDKWHNGIVDVNSTDSLSDLYDKDLTVKFDGGFGTDLTYKGFQLSAFFRFRDKLTPSNIAYIGTPGQMQNEPTEVLNRWQKPGDKAKFAEFTTQPGVLYQDFQVYSDGVYSNGSYIRLQNLSLSYSLPKSIINKANFQLLRIYIHAENLFLITKYHGLDPDVPVFGQLPPAKTIVIGAQINL